MVTDGNGDSFENPSINWKYVGFLLRGLGGAGCLPLVCKVSSWLHIPGQSLGIESGFWSAATNSGQLQTAAVSKYNVQSKSILEPHTLAKPLRAQWKLDASQLILWHPAFGIPHGASQSCPPLSTRHRSMSTTWFCNKHSMAFQSSIDPKLLWPGHLPQKKIGNSGAVAHISWMRRNCVSFVRAQMLDATPVCFLGPCTHALNVMLAL